MPDAGGLGRRGLRGAALVLAVAVSTAIALPIAEAARPSPGKALVGLFKLDPGTCSALSVSGSYFRLAFPTRSAQPARFFFNSGSTCSNQSYTLLVPGTAGGLRTGQYQPNPTPAFSGTGNALADLIMQPQRLGSYAFSVATADRDPQRGNAVVAPRIVDTKGHLSGQLEAWSMELAGSSFDQGTPRAQGRVHRSTVQGTYDRSSQAFVLSWTSPVVGGPFNGFTGYWHLQGTFVPAPKASGGA